MAGLNQVYSSPVHYYISKFVKMKYLLFFGKGKVFTLGREDYGRLGLGENCGEKQLPTLVPALQTMTCCAVGAGGCCSFAVTSEGESFNIGFLPDICLGEFS